MIFFFFSAIPSKLRSPQLPLLKLTGIVDEDIDIAKEINGGVDIGLDTDIEDVGQDLDRRVLGLQLLLQRIQTLLTTSRQELSFGINEAM